MHIDKEERIVILYALYSCGGKGSKGRIISYILSENLLKQRDGDDIIRQGSETKVENDLAWARQDLKESGYLSMPEHGKWAITGAGRKLLMERSRVFFEKPPEPDWFDRYSETFIQRMKSLGEQVVKGASQGQTSPQVLLNP